MLRLFPRPLKHTWQKRYEKFDLLILRQLRYPIGKKHTINPN